MTRRKASPSRIRRRIRRAHLYIPKDLVGAGDMVLYVKRFTALNNLKPSLFTLGGKQVML